MSITDDAMGPRDYLAAVLRRKLRLIIPAVLVLAISFIVAAALPAVCQDYRARGSPAACPLGFLAFPVNAKRRSAEPTPIPIPIRTTP